MAIIEEAYKQKEDGTYGLRINQQKDKKKTEKIREILEDTDLPKILTPKKAHQIFDSFAMEYNPNFVKFLMENWEEILSNPENRKDISQIQRQFSEITTINAGRRITLDVARDFIKNNQYENVEVGNDRLADYAKKAGYSQEDFDKIQSLYNEGEQRDFSSIPRIEGKTEGYTYETLRCDDPLALVIGTLTDCCQEINGAGKTSMEHSVVSPDGRVFVVKDDQGRIVAQSWVWRNQDTLCFDNIEIPDRIFTLYAKEHPEERKKRINTRSFRSIQKSSTRVN